MLNCMPGMQGMLTISVHKAAAVLVNSLQAFKSDIYQYTYNTAGYECLFVCLCACA